MKAYLHRQLARLTASVAGLFVVGAIVASSALAGVPVSPRSIFPSSGVGGAVKLANFRGAGGTVTLANDLYGLAVLFGLAAVIIAWTGIADRRRAASGALAPIVKLDGDSSVTRKAA